MVGAGLAFGLGAGSAAVVAVGVGLLWWMEHRRKLGLVLGFAVQALSDSLGHLAEVAPERGPLGDQVQRCRELCAAILRLVRE